MCFFCMCQYKLFLEIDLDGVYKWMLLLKKKYVVIKVLSNKYETITCGVGPFK
jgi:DNA polymerase elongation subunit (family B)